MALTDIEIRTAKAVEKPLKLFDGGGLYLLVNPNGSRWWRFKYRYEGKERGLSLAKRTSKLAPSPSSLSRRNGWSSKPRRSRQSRCRKRGG